MRGILFLFQIPIATSGIRGMGYLMKHHLRTEGSSGVSQQMITQFVKVKQRIKPCPLPISIFVQVRKWEQSSCQKWARAHCNVGKKV